MSNTHRTLLTRLQSRQKSHDENSHQDILAENMYVRLKHMALHFYKYTSKAYDARSNLDIAALKAVLVDSLIICLASSNSLKIYLDDFLETSANDIPDLCKLLARDIYAASDVTNSCFDGIFHCLLSIGSRMAKVMESTDHMELGNPRAEMSTLVPKLTIELLKYVDPLGIDLERAIETRFKKIESSFIL